MEADNKDLKIAFANYNEKNAELLRTLNLAIFPVQYHNWFYQSLTNYEKYTRLVYFNDILIGAIACREEVKDDAKCLYILILGVLKPYRRYHIGSKMLDEIVKEAKKDKSLQYIYLHIQVNNNSGMKFYEKFGFYNKEKIEGYYTDIEPKDCYLLRLDLQENKKE